MSTSEFGSSGVETMATSNSYDDTVREARRHTISGAVPVTDDANGSSISPSSISGGDCVPTSVTGSDTGSVEASAPPTEGSKQPDIVPASSSDEDEEVRIAKAMALAIQQNPNLTVDTIKKLSTSTNSIFPGSPSPGSGINADGNAAGTPLLIPGRLADMLKQHNQDQQHQNHLDGYAQSNQCPPSPSSSKEKTKFKSNFKMLQNTLKSHTENAKGKIFDIAGTKSLITSNVLQTSVKSYFKPSKSTKHSPPSEKQQAYDRASLENHMSASELHTPDLDDPMPTTATLTRSATAPAGEISDAIADLDNSKVSLALGEKKENEDNQEPIRLMDVVWKLRSGLGKYSASSAWERRRMVLRGTKIYYYRTDSEAAEEAAKKNDDIAPSASKDTAISDDAALQPPATSTATTTTTTTSNSHAAAIPHVSMKIDGAAWKRHMMEMAASWGISDHEDPNVPRGYLDLVKEKATVAATSGHSGAPSPFAISIKVRGETKWKLCFPFHKTQMEWLAALTDVIVQGSVDSYNKELVESTNPMHDSGLFQPTHVNQPPDHDSSTQNDLPRASGHHHRLWMLEPYSIHGLHGKEEVEQDEKTEASSTEVSGVDELTFDETSTTSSPMSSPTASRNIDTTNAMIKEVQQEEKQGLLPSLENSMVISTQIFYSIVILWNLTLFFSRASSTSIDAFWFLVTFSNLVMYLVQEKLQSEGTIATTAPSYQTNTYPKPLSSTSARAATPIAMTPNKPAKAKDQKMSSAHKDKMIRATPVVEGFIPEAGTSAMQIENPTDLPVNKDNHVFAGWRNPSPESFQVRSHGYLTTKKKIESPGSLYNCAHVDIFESPSRYSEMSQRVQLPKVQFNDDGCPKTWKSPDVFVVSIALPTDPPKLGRTTSDGGGYTLTMYFTMNQETRDILKRVTADGYDSSKEVIADIQKSKVNAVRLFEQWCRRAPGDPKFQARFKLIPNVENLAEIGMPQWIAKYNGKPVLIKRAGQTGFLYDHTLGGKSCMEFDVSFHVFPYLAKQAICYMKDNFFKKVLVSWGFVIEGRDDDELPECLIGTSQLCYPDPIHAIQAEEFFAGTCPRSF